MPGPDGADVLIWQAGEVVHFFGIWLLIAGYPPGNAERALSEDGYGVTVLAHVAGTLWLCAVVIRDVLRPENDPVRTDADGTPVADDPAGGVLDGADDTFRLRPATDAARRTPVPRR